MFQSVRPAVNMCFQQWNTVIVFVSQTNRVVYVIWPEYMVTSQKRNVTKYENVVIYLFKQNPRTFVSAITFVTALTCVLLVGVAYSINFHPNSCYFIAGVAGIVSNLYGFCHFRTLMNLKKKLMYIQIIKSLLKKIHF